MRCFRILTRWREGGVATPGSVGALRFFFTGVDEARVKRFRDASVATNKLRGRDETSYEFEKRISLVQMSEPGEMFHGLASSANTAASTKGSLDTKGVAVVCPIAASSRIGSLSAADEPIPLPSMYPMHYDAHVFPVTPLSTSCIADTDTSGAPSSAANFVSIDIGGPMYPDSARKFLRKGCDSGRVRLSDGSWFITIVDPDLNRTEFRSQEAQVELMTAYRNMLYEVVEASQEGVMPASSSRVGPQQQQRAATSQAKINVLRVPVVAVDTISSRLTHQLPKLTQIALIKAFHRVGEKTKRALLDNKMFRIELFVPMHLFDAFHQAFLEEAWATPMSTLNPGRLDLYPGLAPPPAMKTLAGWVGGRPELLEAIETKGASLLKTQWTLDGRVVEPADVMANVGLLGNNQQAIRDMVAREAESAERQQQLLGCETSSVANQPTLDLPQ